jgi:hypothetical protein
MATVILIEAAPWSSADGTVQAVHLAGGGSAGRPYTGYRGFNDWKSGVADRPLFTTAIGFDASGWTGGAVPQTASMRFFPALPATSDLLAGLQWIDAPVTIYSGDDKNGPPAAWTVELTGTIAAANTTDGVLALTIADLSTALDVKVLTARMAGSGGIEGPAEAEGRIKRRTFGQVSNVEGFLLDKANSIYEFGDPSFPIESFDAVRDKARAGIAGAVIAWQGSIAATLAALQAAVVPAGGYRAAPSIACVKWWTQPAGPLTADLKGENTGGYTNVVGTLAARIAGIGGVALAAGTAANANALRPYIVGLHIDEEGETTANVLDRLLLPLSLDWVINPDGTVSIVEFQMTASVETLIAEAVERVETFRPIKSRRVGYLKNHRVQNDGEISPAATSSDSAVYADGTPIDDLRPAEPNANVTGTHTAAAITGQAATATSSDFGVITGGTKPADNATVGAVAGVNLLDAPGGAVLLLAAIKTILGNAAGIAGQGALATLNAADFASQVTGSAKPDANATVGAIAGTNLLDSIAGSVLLLAAIKTILGTAAGISGQGSLATLNSADFASQVGGSAKPDANATVGAIAGVNMLDALAGAVLTLAMIKTALGTAAAIAGQGALATKNVADAAAGDVINLPAGGGGAPTAYGVGSTATVTLDAGQTVSIDWSYGANWTSGSSSIQGQIAVGGAGSGTILVGDSLILNSSEPFESDSRSGTYTNSTGSRAAFTFTFQVTGSGGRTYSASLTWMTVS